MRSILLFADRSPAMAARLETALSLARANRGHLSVLVDTPVARFMSVDAMGGSYIAADAIREALERESPGEAVDSQGRALDPGDGGLLQVGQGAQHGRQRPGVGEVFFHGVAGGPLHPGQVGAGGEALDAAGEDHDAHAVVGIQGLAGRGEIGDEGFIEGVVDLRAVHPQGGDGAIAGDFEGGIHGGLRVLGP